MNRGRILLRRLRTRLTPEADGGDGFPAYVEAARKEGIDVNDWIERDLGWTPALPVLESLVFPLMNHDAVICEVGVGTGRWSRHLLKRIPNGRLVLVDRSPWIARFVRNYFKDDPRVAVSIGDGNTLPIDDAAWADVIFSQGLFITLKLGQVMTYLEAFQKALKPAGVAVFDFIDAETPAGWHFLRREYQRAGSIFSYHTLGSIVECCSAAGLEAEGTAIVGKSTYLTVRKPI